MTAFVLRYVRDGLILLSLLAALWQGCHLIAGDVAITSPAETLAYAGHLAVRSTTFWTHVASSARAFVLALAVAIVVGFSAGLLFALQRMAGEVGEPIFVALYSIPKVTLYPVILLFFGIGVTAKVVFGALHGIVPITLFTLNAVRSTRPVLIKTARVYRLSPLAMIRTILLPAAVPEVFTGLRVGFATTLVGTLVGEMFGALDGLGYLLMRGVGLNEVKLVLAIALYLVTLAFLVNSVLLAIDHRLHRRI
jgi:NitT/TauT family transport system permease protein